MKTSWKTPTGSIFSSYGRLSPRELHICNSM